MKLHLAGSAGKNLFTACNSDSVTVGDQRFEHSLVVTPTRIENWNVLGFERLEESHMQYLLQFKPEIVLLGTGAQLRFPSAAITRCLSAAHIGVEVMDTGAACRTYNILATEDRNVLAAIILGTETCL